MYFSDKIKLISIRTAINDLGDALEKERRKKIYADRKSIRQTEFYQAAATGLKPEIMFVCYSEEYDMQKYLEYNRKRYTIIRTYNKGEFTELVCQGLVNNATT